MSLPSADAVAAAKTLLILGTRGIPARHGGFETFAERLAMALVQRGWRVSVYCQATGPGAIVSTSWDGVELIQVPVPWDSPLGTIIFDVRCMLHACDRGGILLTLGYNTGFLAAVARARGRVQVINMDGVEWRRSKWSRPVRLWFYINEWLAARLADRLVADHPEIARHLRTRAHSARIAVIPYGADPVDDADTTVLDRFGVRPHDYAVVIARPEPENSLLEIVSAFSRRSRNARLIVLGEFRPTINRYHARVVAAAGPDVMFVGAIYAAEVVNALRYFSRLYIHGHQVGGTNPSLLEAMAAGCAILARDNVYNRWVAGPTSEYFADEDACATQLDRLLDDPAALARMRHGSSMERERFRWEPVIAEYERLLMCP